LRKEDKIIIHIDGSSQGNPGLSGVSATFEMSDGKKLLEINKFIGEGTNNQAEYRALIIALETLKAKQLIWPLKTNIEIKTDSELLFNQVNGSYKVKDWGLKKLFAQVLKLKKELPPFKMVIIPREENRTCDKLAKKVIRDAIKSFNIKPKDTNIGKPQTLFS
jgi:ribonuclease HI